MDLPGLLNPLGNANLRRPRPRVALYLFGRRSQGFSGYDLDYRHMTAHAHRNIRRAYAPLALFLEQTLGDTILKRVIRDHTDTTAGICPANRRL